jgi:hypothetical protein
MREPALRRFDMCVAKYENASPSTAGANVACTRSSKAPFRTQYAYPILRQKPVHAPVGRIVINNENFRAQWDRARLFTVFLSHAPSLWETTITLTTG